MSDAISSAEHGGNPSGLPERRVTINQVVAYNMSAYRRAAGLNQDELGARMGGWSAASVSAAERSWDGRRVRKFDGDEIMRIADALGVPVIALFLPPPDAGTAFDYVFDFGTDRPRGLADLLTHLAPTYDKDETAAVAAYRDRLIAVGPVAVADHPIASEILVRAWREADDLLSKARDRSIEVTADARSRAETLQHDAQERHREALASIIVTREQLERHVNELRSFEREYRTRLIAYMEGQLNELRAALPNADEEATWDEALGSQAHIRGGDQ